MNEIKEFVTFRVLFSKTGRARYISHLDLNRAMIRAVRRAGIPLWYTEGFNRHAYLTFAAPLALGVESRCERMDMRLCEAMESEELCRRLNEVMPEGLSILSAAPAVHKAGSLGFARYRLTTPYDKGVLEAFLAQDTILVDKRCKKGGYKTVDVKAAMTDVVLTEAEGGTVLETTLPCNSTDTVNPSLVMTALRAFNRDEAFFSVTRLELYTASGEVFV